MFASFAHRQREDSANRSPQAFSLLRSRREHTRLVPTSGDESRTRFSGQNTRAFTSLVSPHCTYMVPSSSVLDPVRQGTIICMPQTRKVSQGR